METLAHTRIVLPRKTRLWALLLTDTEFQMICTCKSLSSCGSEPCRRYSWEQYPGIAPFACVSWHWWWDWGHWKLCWRSLSLSKAQCVASPKIKVTNFYLFLVKISHWPPLTLKCFLQYIFLLGTILEIGLSVQHAYFLSKYTRQNKLRVTCIKPPLV